MKKRFSVGFYAKRIVLLSSLLAFFLVGIWCDYNTALAMSGGVSWTQSLPYFFDQIVYNIGAMNGLDLDIDQDRLQEAWNNFCKTETTEERYQRILPMVKERYPYNKFFEPAGWSREEWEIFCESEAEYHATSYATGGYKVATPYDRSICDLPIVKNFYGNVMDTLDQALKDDTLKQLCSASGTNIDVFSMANFCYQSKQAIKSDTVAKYGTITTPMGMAVNMVIGTASQCIADILDNPLFKHMNLLYRAEVYQKYNNALMHPAGSSSVGCDYSSAWWADNNTIINCLIRTDITRNYKVSFVSDKLPIDLYIYPLIYNVDNKAYMGLACSGDKSGFSVDCSVHSPSGSSGDRSSVPVAKANDLNFWFDRVLGVNISMGDMYNTRHVLNGVDKACYADNVIDVKTKENFDKFCEYIFSGKYTLAELLNLIEKGWVANPEYEKKAATDGAYAKDVIDKSKDRYKEKDEDYVTAGSIATGVSGASKAKEKDLYGDDVITRGRTWEDILEGSTATMELEAEKAWTAAQEGTLEGVKVVDRVVSIDREAYKEAVEEGTKPSNGGKDKLPFVPGGVPNGDGEMIQWYERFPFCIPWDIYQFISVFSDEPIKPKWSIPFEIPRYKISEKIEIDFSSGDYDKIVKVIRVFLLLSYGSGLALITRNIIKG